MEFIPTDEYIKVSLQEGLNALQIGRVDKLDAIDIIRASGVNEI